MTQMTFDFSTTGFTTGTSSLTLLVRESKNQPSPAEARYVPQPKRPTTSVSKPTGIRTGQSLSLYDSGRKDIQHIGDLAQAVINRYEIVHRRRAARLAREKAAREQLATSK